MPARKEASPSWLKLEFSVPPELLDAVTNYVTELGAEGVMQEEGEEILTGEFAAPRPYETFSAFLPCDLRLEKRLASLRSYLESLAALFPELPPVSFRQEEVAAADWGEQWKIYFKPLRASRSIVVKPTWERYTPRGGDIVVEIDPGMAFGTGQHASTRMCLQAIEDILLKDRHRQQWRVLDVGTGTGILGISCAKLGAQHVVCVDVDKQAVEIARENVRINAVEDIVTVYNRDVATVQEQFDLIVANLTAKLLLKLRSHLLSILVEDGYLVIGGILDQQREDIEEHFVGELFTITTVLTEQEWLAFVLRRR